MSAEQTPDIETLVAKWSGCWCGEQQHPDHDPRVRDCPQHGSDDCRHMAEGIVRDLQALAPVLAAAVREAKAEALREAADLFDGDTLMWRPEDVQYVLRDRADRVAEPQHKAATSSNESEAVMSTEHRPNGCCDYHRHVADGCCHCEGHLTSVRDTAGSWVCGRCRGGPETHAHTDSKCVYDPVWLPLDELRAESEGAGDE